MTTKERQEKNDVDFLSKQENGVFPSTCSLKFHTHTPYFLCEEVLSNVPKDANRILVVFNIEFVSVLMLTRSNISVTFYSTDDIKCQYVKRFWPNVEVIGSEQLSDFQSILEDMDNGEANFVKFDAVVGNPPYNAPRKSANGNAIWDKFVVTSLNLLKDGGYLALIHPPAWRKPEAELWVIMTQYQFHILSIHNQKDGNKTFGVGTRYDWYVLQKTPVTKDTLVIDETGKNHIINLSNRKFLPNYMIEEIDALLANTPEESCSVIHSTDYRSDKDWVSTKKTKKNIYPILIGFDAPDYRFYYSSKKLSHFGESKVACVGCGDLHPINDWKGELGIGFHGFGIPVSSKEEGDKVVTALSTDTFSEISKAIKWGNFQTEWRFFKYLKKDFWKKFL